MPQDRSRRPRPILKASTRARRAWAAPTRPRHGPVLGVLVVVEEDPTAFLLPPFAAREVGCAPFHLTREGQRRASHLLETPAPLGKAGCGTGGSTSLHASGSSA